ncbi:MAG: hypothetical protein H6840_02785 [Planctomycetes bacterium]|nr:hypothetical protein [Planctomycetota bacterium]
MSEPQAHDFPREETTEFLEAFLDGILHEGLTQPLERWFNSRQGACADAARAWHAALARGETPETSLAALQPPFPAPVGELLLEGCKTGELDYVVEDMLAALKLGGGRIALESLLAYYRARRPGTSVCVGCIEREIERLLRRAAAEDAHEVSLRWDPAGYMEQRYFGPYVVTVRQPSRQSVVEAIRTRLQGGGTVAPGILAEATEETGQYVLTGGEAALRVRIEG